MFDDDRAKALGWLLILIVVLAVLDPVCSRRPEVVIPPDPNEKLAEVARESVQMAREAREEAAAVRESSGRWFFIALAAAVIAPLVVALLLFRLYANAPPDDAEVFAQLQELAQIETPQLPAPRQRPLAAPANEDGPAHRDAQK